MSKSRNRPRATASRPKGRPTNRRQELSRAHQAAATRRRRLRLGLVAAGVAIVGGVGAAVAATGGSGASGVTSPNAFVLPSLSGPTKVALTSFRGKPVVVNFFASWCSQCREELPGFASAASKLSGQVAFVEVDSLETGDGTAMANQYGLARAGAVLAKDVGGAQESGLHDALGGGNGMPITAFYDAQGKLLTTHLGAFTPPDLQAQLGQLYGVSVSL